MIHNKAQFRRDTKLSYLGSVNSSAKIVKGSKFNVDTYILYLAPSNLSGYNVCAISDTCRDLCLNTSGRASMDAKGTIERARIKKTKLFYENRPLFMAQLISEIRTAKNRAEKKGHEFSVRLNGTSDLSPTIFKYEGRNILEIFPDVQFYDYTKVIKRTKIADKYDNYHLTFSDSGANKTEVEMALNSGFNVAKVFYSHLPEFFEGRRVLDGDISDLRYKDKTNLFGGYYIGLKMKRIKSMNHKSKAQIVSEFNKQVFIETSHL